MLWIWYAFVFVCNIYSLIVWTVRLSSYEQQYEFIHSRLARASRPAIPRFRFDFKHANWALGDHVHRTLVDAFLTQYLEADGYFFIRMLTSNSSDFVVQEVLEQLWKVYVMKYGENDAIRGEKSFSEFRDSLSSLTSINQVGLSPLKIIGARGGATDSKRKYERQHSRASVGLMRATSIFEPILSTTDEQGEQV